MGYQIDVNLVYGVQLDKNALEIVDVERGCSHGVSNNGQVMKFCSQCGKPAFVEVRKEILIPSMLDKFKRHYDDDSFILGVSLGSIESHDDKPNTVRKVTEEEELELKEFLDFYKLKQTPDVWLVLRHSY